MIEIQPLEMHRDRHDLTSLLAAWPHGPYRSYAEVFSPGSLQPFTTGRMLRLLEEPATFGFVVRSGAGVTGLGSWSRLPWDSEQFGFPAGRVNILLSQGEYGEARQCLTQLLDAILDDCRRQGIRHLVARVDAGDYAAIHSLEQKEFELIDGIQTFFLKLSGTPSIVPVPGELEVRLFLPKDLEQILEIARTSYIYDRFHADSAINNETADALNENWLLNSCLGKAADAVIVTAQGKRILGYVTCKIDRETGPSLGVSIGSIVMVATASDARGRGVARAGTWGALRWLCQQGVQIVEVGTQLRNLEAGRVYENCSFRLSGVSLTLRRLL